MFTAGGSHDRLSCQQGTDLWIDMVYELVPFFMPWKRIQGFLLLIYESFIGQQLCIIKM